MQTGRRVKQLMLGLSTYLTGRQREGCRKQWTSITSLHSNRRGLREFL